MSMNKGEILATVPRLRLERVDIPEWGGTVLVRELSGDERDRFEATLLDMEDGKPQLRLVGARAMLAVLSVVDEDGKRVFSDADIPQVRELSGAALSRIFEVASRLSGLTRDSMDDLLGNSPGGPSAASGSSSPSPSA